MRIRKPGCYPVCLTSEGELLPDCVQLVENCFVVQLGVGKIEDPVGGYEHIQFLFNQASAVINEELGFRKPFELASLHVCFLLQQSRCQLSALTVAMSIICSSTLKNVFATLVTCSTTFSLGLLKYVGLASVVFSLERFAKFCTYNFLHSHESIICILKWKHCFYRSNVFIFKYILFIRVSVNNYKFKSLHNVNA